MIMQCQSCSAAAHCVSGMQTSLFISTARQLGARLRYQSKSTDLRRLCRHASFELNQIFVHMQLHVNVNQSGTAELLLDTRDLIINSVIDRHTGEDLPFKFAEEHKVFATCLVEAGNALHAKALGTATAA